jgi:hypothetical protein
MKFPKATYNHPTGFGYAKIKEEGTVTIQYGAWEALRQYNSNLEDYLCQCIVLLTQNNIEVPNAPTHVEGMLREKFMNAIKGE